AEHLARGSQKYATNERCRNQKPEASQKRSQNLRTRQEYRDNFRQYDREYERRKRLELVSKLGEMCLLCGYNPIAEYNEIHGKRHPAGPRYALAHLNDFVPLCRPCH